VRQSGYVEDLTPGGNAEATLTLTVSAPWAARPRRSTAGAAVSQEYGVTADPQTLAASVVLPHGTKRHARTQGARRLRQRDVHSISANVDVIAPAGLTPTLTLRRGTRTAHLGRRLDGGRR